MIGTSMLSVLFSLTQAQQVPAVPSACQAVWDSQKTALESACKITVNSNTLTDVNTLTSQLDNVCTKACGDAITQAGAAVARDSSCSSYTTTDGLKVADFTSFAPILTSVGCVKLASGNGYCLPAQLQLAKITNLSTFEQLIGVLGQKSVICTDCFQKQITAILATPGIPKNIADIIQPTATSLDKECAGNITVVGSTASPTKTSSAMLLDNGSILALTLSFFGLIL